MTSTAYSNEFTQDELKRFSEMRVAVLSPIMHIEPRWMASTIDMLGYSWERGLKIVKMGMTERLAVDWARNVLARESVAYRDEQGRPFTHFLWLDSDHVFRPDLACQLARHGVDMVSAVYYSRSGVPFPCAYVRTDKKENPYLHHAIMEVPAALVEVDAVGMGACLMSREVFEKVPEPWFTIDFRAGEDIAFCVKAKAHGIKVYLDGAYSIGHIAVPPIVGPDQYAQWVKQNPEKYHSSRVPVQLMGRGAN